MRLLLLLLLLLAASTAGAAPPPGAIVLGPGPGDRSAEINQALEALRERGGGVVHLLPGRYHLARPLRIASSYGKDGRVRAAMHVGLQGAAPPSGYGDAATTLVYDGADRAAAVIDISHALNTTVQDLRIEAGPGRRFRYGVLLHRTESALARGARLPAPTAANLLHLSIAPGAGAFTTGVRLGDPGPDGKLDQNCDHSLLRDLYIEGASDDDNGTPQDLLDGANASGVHISASQVQGNLLQDLHVRRCGTGVFVEDGQLQLFGGSFEDNVQPGPGPGQSLADDNHASQGGPGGIGGGDFIFRTGYAAGHIIQGVHSRGSYRFLGSYLEDQDSRPHQGKNAAWQGDQTVIVAVVDCAIHSVRHAQGQAVLLLGAGGPLLLLRCQLGDPGAAPLHVAAGGYTQGSVVLFGCRFNHPGPPTRVHGDARSRGAPPRFTLLACTALAPSGEVAVPDSEDPSEITRGLLAALPPLGLTPRREAQRPRAGRPTHMDLAQPFTHRGQRYQLRGGARDSRYDNGPALQAALDQVSAAGGGTLWLPAGVFVVRTPLLLRGASGVVLRGVGGRSGVNLIDEVTPIQGTALAYGGPPTQPLLTIRDSRGVALHGLFFTTAARPDDLPPAALARFIAQKPLPGADTLATDTLIHIAQGPGERTEDIWLEDVGAAWLGGSGVTAPDLGVSRTFLKIGDGDPRGGPQRVTLLRAQLTRMAREGVLIDGGALDVQLLLYVASQSRTAVRVGPAGGEFTWLGGGAGNTEAEAGTLRGLYRDPVVVELQGQSGPVVLAGLELQDSVQDRALRTTAARVASPAPSAGLVLLLGNSLQLHQQPAPAAPAPAPARLIDFRLRPAPRGARPTLLLLANGLGTPAPGGATPTLAVGGEATLLSLANVLETQRGERALLAEETAQVEDLGSRAQARAFGGRWPFQTQGLARFTSRRGACALSPERAQAGAPLPLRWRCPRGSLANEVALYESPGTPDDQPLWRAPLPLPSAQDLRAPTQPGLYELRALQRGAGPPRLVQRATLEVLPRGASR